LDLFITKDLNAKRLGSAHSKGVIAVKRGSADSKGVMGRTKFSQG
jgi:hypothetical protein